MADIDIIDADDFHLNRQMVFVQNSRCRKDNQPDGRHDRAGAQHQQIPYQRTNVLAVNRAEMACSVFRQGYTTLVED